MKIIGFAQLHNELRNGNLHNFVSCMKVCDVVYIYDQASDDGSDEIYKQNNYKVHYNEKNDFYNELYCKGFLLDWILSEHSDGWILWLDADEYLDQRLHEREALLDLFNHHPNVDHLFFCHYNLWRSDTHYRTDNKFHWLSGNVAPLWRIHDGLHFNKTKGLHITNMPDGLSSGRTVDYALVHRGFANDDNLIRRFRENFNRYVEHGENPWITMRSIDEAGLSANRIDNTEAVLPSHLLNNDVNPRALKPLIRLKQKEIEDIAGMDMINIYKHVKEWRL